MPSQRSPNWWTRATRSRVLTSPSPLMSNSALSLSLCRAKMSFNRSRTDTRSSPVRSAQISVPGVGVAVGDVGGVAVLVAVLVAAGVLVRVAVEVAVLVATSVAVAVAVFAAVLVATGVVVSVGVAVLVDVLVAVAVFVGVLVAVEVFVAVAVAVDVLVAAGVTGVKLGVAVTLAVAVAVATGVLVIVGEGVFVRVAVAVWVAVDVGAPPGQTMERPSVPLAASPWKAPWAVRPVLPGPWAMAIVPLAVQVKSSSTSSPV